jgi:hypothetical protein
MQKNSATSHAVPFLSGSRGRDVATGAGVRRRRSLKATASHPKIANTPKKLHTPEATRQPPGEAEASSPVVAAEIVLPKERAVA